MDTNDLPLQTDSIDPDDPTSYSNVYHPNISKIENKKSSLDPPIQNYNTNQQLIDYSNHQQISNNYSQLDLTDAQKGNQYSYDLHSSYDQQTHTTSYKQPLSQQLHLPPDQQNNYLQSSNSQQSLHPSSSIYNNSQYTNNLQNSTYHIHYSPYRGTFHNGDQYDISGNDYRLHDPNEPFKYNTSQNSHSKSPIIDSINNSETKSPFYKAETSLLSNRINKPKRQQKNRVIYGNPVHVVPVSQMNSMYYYSQPQNIPLNTLLPIDPSTQNSESSFQHNPVQEQNENLTGYPNIPIDQSYQLTQKRFLSHYSSHQNYQMQDIYASENYPLNHHHHHYDQPVNQPSNYYYHPPHLISQNQQNIHHEADGYPNFNHMPQNLHHSDSSITSQNKPSCHQNQFSVLDTGRFSQNADLSKSISSPNGNMNKKSPYFESESLIQTNIEIGFQHDNPNKSKLSYSEIMYYSKPFDFEIISENNDPFNINQSMVAMDNLSQTFDNNFNAVTNQIKFDNDPKTLDFNMPIIISRLNSTQLQKFIALRKQNFATLFNKNNTPYDLETFHKVKNDILKEWKATKSSIEISYCECKRYIWFTKKKSNCPFCKPSSLIEVSSLANKPVFAIELLNNYVLSILLNKKLRMSLKKFIRPPKNINKISKNLNFSHDGNLYREIIGPIASQVDFALTFSMVVITSTCCDTIHFGSIYFVLNELPEDLKYKPEFLFCAAVFNLANTYSWNTELMRPLFSYLEYLEKNIIKVSLNRHEYHVKMIVTNAISDDTNGRNNCIDVCTASDIFPCIFCTAQSYTLRNSSGHEFKRISGTENSIPITDKILNDLKQRGILVAKRRVKNWALRNSNILENIKYFQIDKNLIFDTKHMFINGIFKKSIIGMINKFHTTIFNENDSIKFQHNVSNLNERASSQKLFSDPSFCCNLFNTLSSSQTTEYDLHDLRTLQFMFAELFSGFSDKFNEETHISVPIGYKYMSLLLELNTYILALWCSDIERNKIYQLKFGLNDLIAELERLSRYEDFAPLNMLLLLPLHLLTHAYDKWDDFGNMNTVSIDKMINSINQLNNEIGSDALYKLKAYEKLKLFNINNCVRIYNYSVPEYPTFKFLSLTYIPFSQMSQKAQGKFGEFNRRYLFEIATNAEIDEVCSIQKIESFVINNLTIYPEGCVKNTNLVRIKGIKRNLGWRFVHIYSMFKVTYTYPVTKETVSAVFIEYKETKTDKVFLKASPNRPSFSIGEFLVPSTSKELRCVWLDDIQMVGLTSLEGSNYVYDPLMTLDRIFKFS